MKLATYSGRSGARVGAITSDGARVVDLAAAAGRDGGPFADMLALIEAGEAGLDKARKLASAAERSGDHQVALKDVRLLAPIPVPPQIRDFSVFPLHLQQGFVGMQKLAAEMQGRPLPEVEAGDIPEVYRRQPVYYFSNRFSVVGPDADVHWPAYSKYMDYEIELAAVIGRKGRDIGAADARGHIFGYTILNDFSARDAQLIEMAGMLGPAKGKSFDYGNALGPWIVTRDEIPDVRALRASVRINGKPALDSDCSAMMHGFEEMVAFVSRGETLMPGEIFGSGTVGNGCGLERFEFLRHGDVVELEFDGIGILRNRVLVGEPPVAR